LRGLSDIRASELGVFHVNDYPEMPATLIADKDRVYPQNGIAPGGQIIRQLKKSGWNGFISLELFNPEYDQLPVELVIRTGLEKTRELLNDK
jgi:2-keto-myo-inositol isomerase